MKEQEQLRFEQLLQDYIANRLTPGDIAVFLQQLKEQPDARERFHRFLADADHQSLLHSNTAEQVDWDRMTTHIMEATTPRPSTLWRNTLRLAAVFILLAGACIYYLVKSKPTAAPTSAAPAGKGADRYQLLPDGSTAIIAAGSTLTYTADFAQTHRAVTLSGKAFFTVAPKAGMPFIVKTGNIETVVLGTRFTIEAYPQQACQVLVASGKVRVQRAGHVLGVLSQNQALRADATTGTFSAYTIAADSSTYWLRQHLQFSEAPLHTIAAMMQDRFGVHILFATPGLGNCQVTAAFDGTETLEETVTLLTRATNTTYTINGKTVTISGEGCQTPQV